MKNWVCRTWTETTMGGWVSEFDRFATKEEAIAHGQTMIELPLTDGELSREFDVYELKLF